MITVTLLIGMRITTLHITNRINVWMTALQTPTASGVFVSAMLTSPRCGDSAASPALHHPHLIGMVWTILPFLALTLRGAGLWTSTWCAPTTSAPAGGT